ncbi:hypothetical protein AB0L26_25660 [Streptomyces nondiastaticus]|uniref:hypothetical protein n=1 Tax=Streptomyces nondiastaticus TaxID=3154512 RepID=UPI003420776C
MVGLSPGHRACGPGAATTWGQVGEGARMPLRVAAVLVCLGVAVGALVETYDIGHSDAKAT